MDAQLVVRKLNDAFSNDDLWTSPSIVDDVEDLADEYDALKSENAKLREQSEQLFDKTLELATENAKLRELAMDMWSEFVCYHADCEDCESCTAPDFAQCRGREYGGRMRELGIEVRDDGE